MFVDAEGLLLSGLAATACIIKPPATINIMVVIFMSQLRPFYHPVKGLRLSVVVSQFAFGARVCDPQQLCQSERA
jgi:hypothetical protein